MKTEAQDLTVSDVQDGAVVVPPEPVVEPSNTSPLDVDEIARLLGAERVTHPSARINYLMSLSRSLFGGRRSR